MYKIIELNDGNKIIVDKVSTNVYDKFSLSKAYLKNNDLLKTFDISINDDMSFYAYSEDMNETGKIEFEFDINDPIYFCLNRLLGNDKEFIIDDDDSREIMKKYMIIKKEENIIKVIFINTRIAIYDREQFSVFIKNIREDLRSKIEDFNTKLRLVKFFRDCENMLLEEYHQITLDEYDEILKAKRLNKINY